VAPTLPATAPWRKIVNEPVLGLKRPMAEAAVQRERSFTGALQMRAIGKMPAIQLEAVQQHRQMGRRVASSSLGLKDYFLLALINSMITSLRSLPSSGDPLTCSSTSV
jgi:hypothetical protein